VPEAKLTEKQMEFKNNIKGSAADELNNQRQFLYSTQQLPAAPIDKGASDSDDSPLMRKFMHG
jgi:hypothetical protein